MINNDLRPESILNEGQYEYPGDRFFFDFHRYTVKHTRISDLASAPASAPIQK